MSQLNDVNIVRLLGICTSHDEPCCIIFEYMKYGDLKAFLRQHVPEGTLRHGSNVLRLGLTPEGVPS